jgi:DNA-binding NarL/FixJ family response regulator
MYIPQICTHHQAPLKTIEVHLSRAYQKPGVRSRTCDGVYLSGWARLCIDE